MMCSCSRRAEHADGVAGAGSNDASRIITVTIVTSEPPTIATMPITSCTNLEERGGKLCWKGSDRRFTGRTVLFPSHVEAYRDGEPDKEIIEPPTEERFPAGQPFQDAEREYVRSHGLSHDTYFFFQKHGTENDIPFLLYGLYSMGETTNGLIVCTRSHCVEALSKITGTNVGYNYSDWAKWWKEKHGAEPVQWKPENTPEF